MTTDRPEGRWILLACAGEGGGGVSKIAMQEVQYIGEPARKPEKALVDRIT